MQIPVGYFRCINVQDHMVVIAHYRIRTDIQSKYTAQLQEPVFDPLSAVLKALPGTIVPPAQESPSYTARDAVVVGCAVNAD